MNNIGTSTYNNNIQKNGMLFSELIDWLKNIDMNAAGTAKANISSISDNNGGRIKI